MPKKKPAKAPQKPAPAAPPPVVIRPLATKATARKRHWGVVLSFILLVLAPVALASWYLYERAEDQFASTVAFTVRSEDVSSTSDLLGGLSSSLTGGNAGDADILYEFIRSQSLVKSIDNQLDLRNFYSKNIETDPVFSFDPDGTIEDLTAYWRRMVRNSYDANSGLMELRVLAFDPEEATLLAQTILAESTDMINSLSAIAREDATRYARDDLDLAIERLKETRENLTAFRIANEIVDPNADIQGQMGLLNTLQAQQAEALIDFDLLLNSTREGDQRLEQARRRIEVIDIRIRDERRKFGVGGASEDEESYATTIAGFERLTVEREIAEQAYAAALVGFDSARAEAKRQSRYLAAYIQPTLAERAEFPNRPLLISIIALFGFLTWAILTLVYYSLRDRR